MGLWDFFSDVGRWVKDKVERAVDWVKDKLSRSSYDKNDVEDQVNVDAVLAEFRKEIKGDVAEVEKKCMESISKLFTDLKEKTKDSFPDLVEIVEDEQEKAEKELKGTILRYVKEHISKNDPKFLKVLEMRPGSAKNTALENFMTQVLVDAERIFNSKLKKYAENLLEEFTNRLTGRINHQEQQMNQRLAELEQMQREAEDGQIDVDALIDKLAPTMEAAQCILDLLEMEG